MLCTHDLMLPDFPTLHTKMLLGAWEAGFDGVSEEAAKLLMLSLQVLFSLSLSHSYSLSLSLSHLLSSLSLSLSLRY